MVKQAKSTVKGRSSKPTKLAKGSGPIKRVGGKPPKTLQDLRSAKYNPRVITDRQKTQLGASYDKFGDLSGIIFNRRTGTLVGGHQRTDIFKRVDSRIESKDQRRDAQGTVAVGHVVIRSKGGVETRIPYREVDWDTHTEMAANVAANAAGGSFDMVKLGRVLHSLQSHSFEIESLPLDAWDVKRATASLAAQNDKDKQGFGSGSFEKVDVKGVEGKVKHTCPKCGYRW